MPCDITTLLNLAASRNYAGLSMRGIAECKATAMGDHNAGGHLITQAGEPIVTQAGDNLNYH
jgi:hypothetical protein